MFFQRRRRRGGGLISLLVVGLGLYATGAGSWLTDRVAKLPGACAAGFAGQQALCNGVQTATDVAVSVATISGGALDRVTGFVGDAKMPEFLSSGDDNNASAGLPQNSGLSIDGVRQQFKKAAQDQNGSAFLGQENASGQALHDAVSQGMHSAARR